MLKNIKLPRFQQNAEYVRNKHLFCVAYLNRNYLQCMKKCTVSSGQEGHTRGKGHGC